MRPSGCVVGPALRARTIHQPASASALFRKAWVPRPPLATNSGGLLRSGAHCTSALAIRSRGAHCCRPILHRPWGLRRLHRRAIASAGSARCRAGRVRDSRPVSRGVFLARPATGLSEVARDLLIGHLPRSRCNSAAGLPTRPAASRSATSVMPKFLAPPRTS